MSGLTLLPFFRTPGLPELPKKRGESFDPPLKFLRGLFSLFSFYLADERVESTVERFLK